MGADTATNSQPAASPGVMRYTTKHSANLKINIMSTIGK